MNSLLKRTITGTIYVALIVGSILWTGWAFPVVCTIFGLFGLIEFDKLTYNVGNHSGRAFGIDMLFSLLLLLPAAFGVPPFVGLVSFSLYIAVRLIAQLYLKSESPIVDVAKSMLSMLWIVAPLVMLEQLFDMSRELVLTLFIMIWLNDTGAFCTGSLAGRTKLFERISPKKTWEGFAGGLVATAVFGYFAPTLLGLCGLNPFCSEAAGLAIGVGVSVASTFGDLCESLFKRALHAKDSGTILPGHGGILDRIDSLLVVSATAFAVCLLTIFI